MATKRDAKNKKSEDGPKRAKRIEDLPATANKGKEVKGGMTTLPIDDYSTNNMMAP